MKHNLFSRFISVLLAVVMLAGLMSMPSLADTVTGTDTAATDNVNITEDDTEATTAPAALSEEDGEGDKEPADSNESSEPTDDTETTGDVQEPEEGTEDTQEPADTNEGTVGTDDTQEPVDTTGDEADNTVASVNTYAGMTAAELSDAIMACQSVDEAEAIVAKLTEDEMSAYLAEIGSEKEKELESHIADLYNAEESEEPVEESVEDSSEIESDDYEEHVPEIVSAPLSPVPFTNAVPMFGNTSVGSATGNGANSPLKSARLAAPLSLSALGNSGEEETHDIQDTEPGNGLNLKKYVTENEDGTYTVNLEAWTEGTVTTSETTKPLDIVLVLDQSGSMANGFESVVYNEFQNQTASNIFQSYRNNTYVKLGDNSYSKVTINRENQVTGTQYVSAADENNFNLFRNQDKLYYKDANNQYHKVTVTEEDTWYIVRVKQYTYSTDNGEIWVSEIRVTVPDFARDFYYLENTYSTVYTFTYTDEDGVDQTVTINPNDVAQTTFGDDQSGKKLYYTTSGGTERRLNALTNAVDQFIDSVQEKTVGPDGEYGTEDDVHHRIAVVGYSSSGYNNTELLTGVEVKQGNYMGDGDSQYYPKHYQYNGSEYYTYNGWQRVPIPAGEYRSALQDVANTDGYNNVKAAVGYLTAHGGTQTDAGLDMANQIFENNQIDQQERERVVILFTDGIPTGSGSSYDKDCADKAIDYANTAKNEYGAKVYAIGIFDGADPTFLGNENPYYGDDDEKNAQRGNYFMQQVSSNNGRPQNPSYYLAASNSTELNEIFESISQTTSTSSQNLNSETVVQDVVTDYFTVPETVGASGTSNVTVKSYKYDGIGFADDGKDITSQVTFTCDDNTVQVTGFDFSKKFISENGRSEQNPQATGNYYGEKLVISFTIVPNENYWGGNQTPTNVTTESGVYASAEDVTTNEMVESFPEPTPVDIQPKYDFNVQNQTIYISNKPVYQQLIRYVEDYDEPGTPLVTGGTAKNNDGVNIVYTVKEKDSGKTVGTYTIEAGESKGTWTIDPSYSEEAQNISNCTDYTIICQVVPAKDGLYEADVVGSKNATVHVLIPQVEVKDTQINLGETADLTQNLVGTGWVDKNEHTGYESVIGEEPSVKVMWTYVAGNSGSNAPNVPRVPTLFDDQSKYALVQDTDFAIKAYLNDSSQPQSEGNFDVVNNNQLESNVKDHFDNCILNESEADHDFTVHVLAVDGTLIIQKTVSKSAKNGNPVFNFKVTSDDDGTIYYYQKNVKELNTAVQATPDGGVSLPAGIYTVEELDNLAYSCTGVTLTGDGETIESSNGKIKLKIEANGTSTVTFTNEGKDNNIPTDNSGVKNNYKSVGNDGVVIWGTPTQAGQDKPDNITPSDNAG